MGRAMDALIAQRDYLYEICVSDDCSPDGTWDVLLNYQRQYPDLVKLHRNEVNVGIFKNIEQVWTMPTGDVMNTMAGDDVPGDGWFKNVVEYIHENNIDWKNELFTIYGDHRVLYPSGDSLIVHNVAIEKRPDLALRLGLRGLISNRGCCFSINILKKFEKVSVGRSHIAETAQDRQLQLFTEKNYYIPQLSNVYYGGIGVSTHVNDNFFLERLDIWSYAEAYIESKGVKLCKKDKNYGKYNIALKYFRRDHSVKNFLKVVATYLSSRDFSLPSYGETRRLVFDVLRHLPHKNPIEFN